MTADEMNEQWRIPVPDVMMARFRYGNILMERKYIKSLYSKRPAPHFHEFVAERMKKSKHWRVFGGSSFGRYAVLKERKKRKKWV